ncbi:MAG: acylphosphatase [Lachnospiraceae bacterium]|nr:acylphosphatase [Lachnospiraceae bacterium]
MDKIRIKAEFYGQVQGVGFRYTARHAAGALGLTGWVRNEYDGSVSAEVQGDRAVIQEWLRVIQSGRYIEISHIDMNEIATIDDERSFRVDY